MKYNITIIGLLSLMLFACNPNKDIYDDIDAEIDKETKNQAAFSDRDLAKLEYTLLETDYAFSTSSVAKYKSFGSKTLAKDSLPMILDKRFFAKDGFEMKVFYKYYRGASENLAPYKSKYEFSDSDYSRVNTTVKELGLFTTNFLAKDHIQAILKAGLPDAKVGDIKKIVTKEGDQEVLSAKCIKMAKSDYTIIVDLVKADDAKKKFVDEKYKNSELYYGANSFTGSFEGRYYKWKKYDEYKDKTDSELKTLLQERREEAFENLLAIKYPSATINDGSGKGISYAIKYTVYDGETKVKYIGYRCLTPGPNPTFELLGDLIVTSIYEYYEFDGSNWNIEKNIYRLTTDDYKLMGKNSYQPGKYFNFTKTIKYNDFLPIFLKNKFQYEKEGTSKLISYLYYNGFKDVEIKATEYIYTNGKWVNDSYVIVKSNKFKFILDTRKWEYVVDVKLVKTTDAHTKEYELKIDVDYALVGNGKYKNFDIREGKEDNNIEVVIGKLTTILKSNNSLKIGDIYKVTYIIYDGATKTVSINLKVIPGEE